MIQGKQTFSHTNLVLSAPLLSDEAFAMTSDRIQLERGDTIVFKDLRISFRTTDKLPDQPLDAAPVQHGSYTLSSVSHYSERLPKDFAASRGVMLELPGSEGMVVTFASIKPYCVKI